MLLRSEERRVGKSQKIAKEEAARQAWVKMGWGPRKSFSVLEVVITSANIYTQMLEYFILYVFLRSHSFLTVPLAWGSDS